MLHFLLFIEVFKKLDCKVLMDAAMQCESVGCEIISHKKIKNPKNTEKGKLLYKFHKRRFKKSQSINTSLWSKLKKIIIMKILPTLGQVGEERPSLKTSLPYCQAVIYEIQRLAAVAPQSIPHRVTQVLDYSLTSFVVLVLKKFSPHFRPIVYLWIL